MKNYSTSIPHRASHDQVAVAAEHLLELFVPLKEAPVDLFSPLLTRIQSLLVDLRAALARESKNALTKARQAADERRDGLTIGLRNTLDGQRLHFLENHREAAERLLGYFERRTPRFQHLGFDVNTNQLQLLLADMRSSEGQQALATLGISAWVDELAKSQDDFIELDRRHAEIAVNDQTPMLTPVRRELRAHISLLLSNAAFLAGMGLADWEHALEQADRQIREMRLPRTDTADPEVPEVV